jgi:hypothetical protein
MILSCYPRSGSSWFVRVLADSFDLYLTNKDQSYKNEGYSSRYEKAFAQSKDKSIAFIDKSHYESFMATKSIEMNIDDKFIFLYRDPRDAILSYYYFLFHRKKQVSREIVFQYVRHFQLGNAFALGLGRYDKVSFDKFFYVFAKYQIKRWIQYYEEWCHRPGVLSLSYEEVVCDTKSALLKVATYFDIEYDENLVGKAIEKWSIENTKLAFNDTGLDKNERMVRSAKTGEWKETFSAEYLNLFEQELSVCSYVLDGCRNS